MTQRIAIYGGTFDPIHNGHLGSIAELQKRLSIDRIHLIPAYMPALRDTPSATSRQRLEMLQQVAGSLAGAIVDDREIQRQGTSYTVDSLSELRNEYDQEDQLFFVLGSDAFERLDEWHQWSRLTDYAHLVVMKRPELSAQPSTVSRSISQDNLELVLEWLEERLVDDPLELDGPAGKVVQITLPQIDISATDIRNRVRLKRGIEKLVPKAVSDYVTQHNLYA